MPNLTTPIPPRLTGEASADVAQLKKWGTALIDELTYLFNNLDSGNVIEAASVKAENIETTNAKITNAQIGALSADKLTAGSLDTEKVSVKDKDGNLTISGSTIILKDRSRNRFVAAYDKRTGEFKFELYNEKGEPTVSIGSGGDAIFSGILESAKIFASTIVGTHKESYDTKTGGVFADIDEKGIKVMQDKNGRRSQKLGMTVSNNGTAYMVLGEGDGGGKVTINDVVYTNGSFKIEKNESYASLGIVGSSPFINFWDNSGELWLNGSQVMVNGINVLSEIRSLWEAIASISQQ